MLLLLVLLPAPSSPKQTSARSMSGFSSGLPAVLSTKLWGEGGGGNRGRVSKRGGWMISKRLHRQPHIWCNRSGSHTYTATQASHPARQPASQAIRLPASQAIRLPASQAIRLHCCVVVKQFGGLAHPGGLAHLNCFPLYGSVRGGGGPAAMAPHAGRRQVNNGQGAGR